jgi:phosphoglycerate dehydrogenase-like enzyme
LSDRFRIGITGDFLDGGGKLAFPDIGLHVLEGQPVEWEFIPENPDEITPDIAARYDALLCLRPKVTAASVGRGDRRLAIVARFGVGYDRVDVDALTSAGVLLAITPEGVRRPVAQAVLTLILALAGRLLDKDRITRAGEGFSRAGEFMGMGITGRTLGLLGIGNIGADVARLVAPFEMRVLAHDPYARPLPGVQLVDAETLFRESDFVSVNCLLNEQTRGMVDAGLIGLMKPTAYLINTARGPIVDEAALYQASTSSRRSRPRPTTRSCGSRT